MQERVEHCPHAGTLVPHLSEKGTTMPNWCFNYMTLNGSKREIRKFLKDITVAKDNYDMNKLVPLDPRSSKEITSVSPDGKETVFIAFSTDTDGFDGYKEATELWGSKWGACDVQVDLHIPTSPTIRYESAWSPCTELIKNISVQYPNVVFSVVSTEESRMFAIYEIIHNGIVVDNEQIDPQQCLTPELEELYQKASSEGSEEAWEEWYEAESEWNSKIENRLTADCEAVTEEYIKHLAKSKRRIREGKEPETFIPLI